MLISGQNGEQTWLWYTGSKDIARKFNWSIPKRTLLFLPCWIVRYELQKSSSFSKPFASLRLIYFSDHFPICLQTSPWVLKNLSPPPRRPQTTRNNINNNNLIIGESTENYCYYTEILLSIMTVLKILEFIHLIYTNHMRKIKKRYNSNGVSR